jgi:nucleoside-diphosphate-sugar epimerase
MSPSARQIRMTPPASPVLVTGGAGFLGARLVRFLVAQGATVHLVARPSTQLARVADIVDRVTVHRCDLADAARTTAVVEAVDPRTVFHIAATGAYGSDRVATLFRDNVLATFHLLQATAGCADCRFIHAASSLEPGPRPVPIREDDPFAPAVPYGAAKAAATLLVRQAAATGRPVVMLRPFTIYGPGEPDARLVPTAIRAAFAGTPMQLTAASSARDLVFVDDVVDAFVLASTIRGIEGELIHVATGRATTAADVVRMVEHVAGRPIRIAPDPFPAKPTDTPLWCADVSRAQGLLGWRPAHDLLEGLTKTVEWYRRRHASRD